MNDRELIRYFQKGFLVGPEEDELSFTKRVKEHLQKKNACSTKIQEVYGIHSSWVEVIYANKGLLPWEGGCTFVSSTECLIQLRNTFEKSSSYFFYSKEEILSHELIHASRWKFEEPLFEEILAYQTSSSRLRRFLGPLFKSSYEGIFFLLSLLLIESAGLWLFNPLWIFGGALSLCGVFLLRLSKLHFIFHRCCQRLTQIAGEKQRARSVMLLLRDQEIIEFSKKSSDEIRKQLFSKHNKTLRHRQIEALLSETAVKSLCQTSPSLTRLSNAELLPVLGNRSPSAMDSSL